MLIRNRIESVKTFDPYVCRDVGVTYSNGKTKHHKWRIPKTVREFVRTHQRTIVKEDGMLYINFE